MKLHSLMVLAAVSAMALAGCESSEIAPNNEPKTENLTDAPLAGQMGFSNGTAMRISSASTSSTNSARKAMAAGNNADSYAQVAVPTGIERTWFLEADGFSVRTNGAYEEDVTTTNQSATLDAVKITEENLTVTVNDLAQLVEGNDYTYEVYLWVKEQSWTSFTAEEKAQWVSGDSNGTDITADCTPLISEGFTLRYNVYKGLSGQKDTPYIKVSLHITKGESENVDPSTDEQVGEDDSNKPGTGEQTGEDDSNKPGTGEQTGEDDSDKPGTGEQTGEDDSDKPGTGEQAGEDDNDEEDTPTEPEKDEDLKVDTNTSTGKAYSRKK